MCFMRRTFRWPQFDNVRLQKFKDADRLSIVLKLLDLKMHYRFKYLRLRKSLFIRILALLLEKLVKRPILTPNQQIIKCIKMIMQNANLRMILSLVFDLLHVTNNAIRQIPSLE